MLHSLCIFSWIFPTKNAFFTNKHQMHYILDKISYSRLITGTEIYSLHLNFYITSLYLMHHMKIVKNQHNAMSYGPYDFQMRVVSITRCLEWRNLIRMVFSGFFTEFLYEIAIFDPMKTRTKILMQYWLIRLLKNLRNPGITA